MIAVVLAATLLTTSAARVGNPAGSGSAHLFVASEPERARPSSRLALLELRSIRRTIADRRVATWRHERDIGIPLTDTRNAERRTRSAAYLGWLRRLWATRADERWRLRVRLRDPEAAIRFVFGRHAADAIEVAECESGDRDGDLSEEALYAGNGQYRGMFQMGASERELYGHGSTALEQARAAHRYFVRSGRDWSPWQCRPGGRLAW